MSEKTMWDFTSEELESLFDAQKQVDETWDDFCEFLGDYGTPGLLRCYGAMDLPLDKALEWYRQYRQERSENEA